jgi:hypothetical protein
MNVNEFKREGVFFTDADVSEIVKAGPKYAIYFEAEQGYTTLMIDRDQHTMRDFTSGDTQDVYQFHSRKNMYFLTADSDWFHLYYVDRRRNKMSVYIMPKDENSWSLI